MGGGASFLPLSCYGKLKIWASPTTMSQNGRCRVACVRRGNVPEGARSTTQHLWRCCSFGNLRFLQAQLHFLMHPQAHLLRVQQCPKGIAERSGQRSEAGGDPGPTRPLRMIHNLPPFIMISGRCGPSGPSALYLYPPLNIVPLLFYAGSQYFISNEYGKYPSSISPS